MEKLRKLLAGLSVAALMTSVIGFSIPAQAQTFSDVDTDHWAYDAVEELVDDGVFDEADEFRCNDGSNRAEVAKTIAIAYGFDYEDVDYDLDMNDVSEDDWYYPYVATLAQAGVVNGTTDENGDLTGNYEPADMVTRAAIAKMIILAGGYEVMDGTGAVFSDVSSSDWYAEYVETGEDLGLWSGYSDGTYGPGNDVTRCELAVMLTNEPSEGDGDDDDDGGGDGSGDDDDDDTPDPDPDDTSDGELTVEMGDEIEGRTLPQGGTRVEVLNIELSADSGGDIEVDQIILSRNGVGSSSDIANVYLYEGDTRLTTGRSFNSTDNTATFSSLSYDVEAGETETLTVVIDVSATATSGSEHEIALESVEMISSNATSTDGDFPLESDTFQTSETDAGTVTVTKYGTLSDPAIGDQDAEVAQFRMEVSGEDMWVDGVSLRVRGDVSSSAITNCSLWDQSNTEVATVDEVTAEDLLVFDFDTSYYLEINEDEIFSVTCDIGASADPNDLLVIDIDETSDVDTMGDTTGVGGKIDIDNSDGYDGTDYSSSLTSCSTVNDASCVLIEGGQVTITFNGPSADEVAVDANDVVLFDFSLTSQTEAEVRQLQFTFAATTEGSSEDSGLVKASDTTVNYSDIKVTDVDDGGNVCTMTLSSSGSDTSQTLTCSDAFIVDNETRNFQITADVANNTSMNGDVLTVTMAAVSTSEGIKDLTTNEFVSDIVPSTAIAGYGMTIETPSLSLALASTPDSDTTVKGTSGVETIGFSFTAGDASDVTIDEVSLSAYVSSDATSNGFTITSDSGVSAHTVVTQVELYDEDGNMVSNSAETISSSTGKVTFTNLDWTVEAGQSSKLIPVVTIDNGTTPNGTDNDAIAFDIAAVGDVAATDEDSSSVSLGNAAVNISSSTATVFTTIKSVGKIVVEASDDPVLSDKAVAGADSSSDPLLVARYSIYAQDEAMTVEEMTFTMDSGADNSLDDIDAIDKIIVKYPTDFDDSDTLDGSSSKSVTTGSTTVTGMDIAVPVSDSDENEIQIEVYVVTNDIESGGNFNSGSQIEMDFDEGQTFEAVGVGSGTTITHASDSDQFGTTADVDANEISLYKTLPSFEYHTATTQCSGGLEGTSTDRVYCLAISMDDNAAGALYSLTFAATPNLLNTGTSSGQLGVTNGFTITEYDSSGTIGSAIGSGTWSSNTVTITFNSEEVIAAGDTNYYVVKAPISYQSSTDTSSISVYLQEDTSHAAMAAAASVSGNIVWSDRSATSHSASTTDWTNGFKLESLPTTTLKSTE